MRGGLRPLQLGRIYAKIYTLIAMGDMGRGYLAGGRLSPIAPNRLKWVI